MLGRGFQFGEEQLKIAVATGNLELVQLMLRGGAIMSITILRGSSTEIFTYMVSNHKLHITGLSNKAYNYITNNVSRDRYIT